MKANKNKEGMRYPSIDELLKVKCDPNDEKSETYSKYKLAFVSALRAAEIDKKNNVEIRTICSKNVGVALEEILEDKIEVEFKEIEFASKEDIE